MEDRWAELGDSIIPYCVYVSLASSSENEVHMLYRRCPDHIICGKLFAVTLCSWVKFCLTYRFSVYRVYIYRVEVENTLQLHCL